MKYYCEVGDRIQRVRERGHSVLSTVTGFEGGKAEYGSPLREGVDEKDGTHHDGSEHQQGEVNRESIPVIEKR